MTVTALVGIAESGEAAAFSAPWWFAPFGLNTDRMFDDVLPKALRHGRLGVSCGANSAFIPYPLPAGEPEAQLLTWPAARCGLAMVIVPHGKDMQLAGFWPFVTEGAQHTAVITRVLLSPDRLEGVIEGTVGNAVALAWNDVFFPLDRGYYAQGSVHEVLLAGIADELDIGPIPSVKLTPDAPSYGAFREAAPRSVGSDGVIEFDTRNLAAILPGSPSAPTLHSIHGPVKSVEPYRFGGELFGRKMWELRVTVARLEDRAEPDFDLAVFVTDLVLKGQALPKIGDVVHGFVRLQARIWHPNVKPKA